MSDSMTGQKLQEAVSQSKPAIRQTRAQFARTMEVSRQTVTRWAQEGKILIGPDGKLDPVDAAKRLMFYCDPTKMKARVLKPLVDDAGALRKHIGDLEQQVAELLIALDNERRQVTEYENVVEMLPGMLLKRWDELYRLTGTELSAAIDDLMDHAMILSTDDNIEPWEQELNAKIAKLYQ